MLHQSRRPEGTLPHPIPALGTAGADLAKEGRSCSYRSKLQAKRWTDSLAAHDSPSIPGSDLGTPYSAEPKDQVVL